MNNKQIPPAEVTDEREAFEAEMRCEDVWGHRSLKRRTDGRYENRHVDLMWDVWQARAILALRPGDLLYTHPAPGVLDVLKDHQIAAMVNSLRDIALQFHGHGSLRERIANVLVPALKAEGKTDEPIYQICKADSVSVHSAWVDVDKQAYDDAGLYPEYRRRVLYTHPAPGVPEDVAQDAQRYRWLRRKACVIGKTTYCGEETGQPILDFVNLPDVTEVIRRDSATTLDAAIDAAMLAASPAQKG